MKVLQHQLYKRKCLSIIKLTKLYLPVPSVGVWNLTIILIIILYTTHIFGIGKEIDVVVVAVYKALEVDDITTIKYN